MAEVIRIDQRSPRAGECLYCYLTRVSETIGCDHTFKLMQRWISAQQRKHGWVVQWSEDQGARCDCEVIFSVFRDNKKSARHRKVRCAASYELAATEIGECRGVGG